ncbi:MAG: hypothetical protein LBN23_02015 [Paludibacter sp.]|jgi:hypothetical protein|nr:hypothetical protein [Paludibacter sp.]
MKTIKTNKSLITNILSIFKSKPLLTKNENNQIVVSTVTGANNCSPLQCAIYTAAGQMLAIETITQSVQTLKYTFAPKKYYIKVADEIIRIRI